MPRSNEDQTFAPDMLNTEVEPEDNIPVQVYGRLNRYVLNDQPRDTDVWYFLFNNNIYLADTDEVTEAQEAHPLVREALESMTHGRRRAEVRELPCYHYPPLEFRLHTREHRQWDFIQWWDSVRPGRPAQTTARVEPEMVDPGEPPVNTASHLNFTFNAATATMPEDELLRAARERAERMVRNRERRRDGLPEEGPEDAPRWDGLPSSQPLLAARTRRGYGSCIERQAQAECPPSCPCRTSPRAREA